MNLKFPKLSFGNISPIRRDDKLSSSKCVNIDSVLAAKYFLDDKKQSSSIDISSSIPSPHKDKSIHQKEFERLENELDFKEIQSQRDKNIEREFEAYQSYLHGLSFCVRFVDKDIAKGIIRGIIGFTKVYKELMSRPLIAKEKRKFKLKDSALQTDEEVIKDD